MEKGLLVVISGPSGAGKGTICKELVRKNENLNVSISATSRKPRIGEVDGINYFFMDEEEFVKYIEQDYFIENALVYGNHYGTPKSNVFKDIENGHDVILEIDIQGALKVKENHPEGIYIFILPPSISELKNRIVSRGTDSEEVIIKRMANVYEELNNAFKYDYVVKNDLIENAVNKIQCILIAEKNKAHRKETLINKIKEE